MRDGQIFRVRERGPPLRSLDLRSARSVFRWRLCASRSSGLSSGAPTVILNALQALGGQRFVGGIQFDGDRFAGAASVDVGNAQDDRRDDLAQELAHNAARRQQFDAAQFRCAAFPLWFAATGALHCRIQPQTTSELNGLRRGPRRKESPMTLTALLRAASLAAVVAAGVTAGAAAQTTAADPHHPDRPRRQRPPSPA